MKSWEIDENVLEMCWSFSPRGQEKCWPMMNFRLWKQLIDRSYRLIILTIDSQFPFKRIQFRTGCWVCNMKRIEFPKKPLSTPVITTANHHYEWIRRKSNSSFVLWVFHTLTRIIYTFEACFYGPKVRCRETRWGVCESEMSLLARSNLSISIIYHRALSRKIENGKWKTYFY